jgi:hypothetical protein
MSEAAERAAWAARPAPLSALPVERTWAWVWAVRATAVAAVVWAAPAKAMAALARGCAWEAVEARAATCPDHPVQGAAAAAERALRKPQSNSAAVAGRSCAAGAAAARSCARVQRACWTSRAAAALPSAEQISDSSALPLAEQIADCSSRLAAAEKEPGEAVQVSWESSRLQPCEKDSTPLLRQCGAGVSSQHRHRRDHGPPVPRPAQPLPV